MSTHTNVALMTPDASVAAAVAAALQSNGHVIAGPALQDLRDLLAQLGKAPVPIVLVDLDPQPKETLRQLERIISRFPACRFVALSGTIQNDLLVEAMQTGIRRVVTKHSMAAELGGVLNRLTVTEEHEGPRGEVLTILSASGGCGATTLAVNLAEELALQQKQPTLLFDLDCCYGAVASYLGLHVHYASDQVLNSSGDIDGQLIHSTATVFNERLHVLANPVSVSVTGPEPLRFDRLEIALESARDAYSSTVVDAPRIPIEAAARLVAGSAHTLLVFQLTVKDLRMARATLDAIRQHGVDIGSVIPVANRYVKRQMIGLEEANKALGGIQVICVRNDYTPAIRGLNYGQPLSEAGPRSALRKDLLKLLARLGQKKPAAV